MRTIIDVVAADGRFTKLGATLAAAGLVDFLKTAGPFTVFAPTDEAFDRLPAGTLDGWLQDAAKLTALLRHHVLVGKVSADDLAKLGGKTVPMLQGEALRISTKGGVAIDGDIHVAKHGIAATNGLVHVIDGVLLPPQ
jgi:uncharacterized surface protein with fasciclin (FAS1) repeats